uniref:Kazal-like domain-containing protein n=1 Tax=Xiphophorus couchianus TaxID=32473 RepID=A0A3B5M8E4_9TELE
MLWCFYVCQPSCPALEKIMACPMNFAPVCGSDGNTYANECLLCVQRQGDAYVDRMGKCHQILWHVKSTNGTSKEKWEK